MKKLVGIALIVAVALTLCLGTVAMAADPVDVNMNWSGSGSVGTTVTAGNDGVIQFATGGTGISGTFTARDWNDNPYAYNVDTIQSYLDANVTEGSIWYQAGRTDSYAPMYGHSGQVVESFVGVSGGSGEMATGTWTNYARMANGTYGQPHTNGGKNFEVNASSYYIYSFIGANGSLGSQTDNWAMFQSLGSGTAAINCMTTEASGCGTTGLGWGGGCYTNANAAFTGSGQFRVDATGTNQIVTPIADAAGNPAPGAWTIPGNGTYASCSYSVIANFVGNFGVSNYSVKVN